MSMVHRKKRQEPMQNVMHGGSVVDVAVLRAEASRAGTRFWVLLVVVSLLSSMVMPYLSMASVVASDSKVFDGEVIPGYSMGGIDIASYGVDINKWGQSDATTSSPKMVQSTYGYWNKKRAADAESNLKASIDKDKKKKEEENAVTPLADYEAKDEIISDENKAKAWIGVTRNDGEGRGLSDFKNVPEGHEPDADRYNYSEGVAPYRTQEDWKFWDSQAVGGQNTSITTTIYPDFVVFGWDEKNQCARVLTNPDAIQNVSDSNDSTSMVMNGTSAVPHYVPLSTLFEAFGIADTVMNADPSLGMNDMDTLLDAIDKDAAANNGKSPILNKIVKNEKHDQKNDLLLGTHYENLNQGKQKNGEKRDKETDAWNPYPYSMVFSMGADGNNVVSSIYNNTEAYVYFSPRSVYNNYLNLRQEYDALVGAGATQIAEEQPQSAFQLGYYLAGMAILEAYLNEALPQDMTRGYVGPAEGNPKATTDSSLSDSKKLLTRSEEEGTVYKLFPNTIDGVANMVASDIDATSASETTGDAGFKTVAYSQLMYDFADAAISRGSTGGEVYLGATSAIMNSLSTYGYGVVDAGALTNKEKESAGQGPNRGMSRRQNMSRITNFGPYQKAAEDMAAAISKDEADPLFDPKVENTANTGFYIPVYYPIQQHEMPADPEMKYRFQLLSLIPYPTLTYELGQHKFDGNVTLSYSNMDINTLDATKRYYNKVASLAQQFEDMSDDGQALSGYDESASIVINPEAAVKTVNDQSTNDYASRKDTTARVDNALMAFANGRMNSDNVHDLVDIARAIPGVKYETFVRYFNPIKSAGGANDLFLTRISPAQTAYLPGMLTKGYESAGGVTNNESIASTSSAAFDYFSVPSFSPCFAAHTAENTFYGALSYELRGFYTRGFLSGLPAAANVPALEKYEEAKEEKEEIEASTSIADVKPKMLTIYILAKRLAYATAYSKLKAAQGGGDGSVQLGPLYHSDLTKSPNLEPTWSEVAAALTPADDDKYIGAENDQTEGATAHLVDMTIATEKDNNNSASSPSAAAPAANSSGGASGDGEGGDGGEGNSGDAAQIAKRTWAHLRTTADEILNPLSSLTGAQAISKMMMAFTSGVLNGAAKADRMIGDYYLKLKEAKKHYGLVDSSIPLTLADRELLENLRRDAKNRSEGVAVGVIQLMTGALSGKGGRTATARAFPIDTGDYIEATTYQPSSQLTAYYDNGDGTTGVVSYGRMPDGRYEPQATGIIVEGGTGLPQPTPQLPDGNDPSLQVTTTDPVNGIPTSGIHVEFAGDPGGSGLVTPPSPPVADPPTKTIRVEGIPEVPDPPASDPPASDPPASDPPTPDSSKKTPPKTIDSNAINSYPVNAEAKQVYKKDSLAKKSYNCSPQATWKEAAGTHHIGDAIKFHLPSDYKLPTGSGFDFVMQQFGVKHAVGDDAALNKNVIWCSDSKGNAFVTNLRTLFAGLYRQEFNTLLTGNGDTVGTYFWESAGKIAEVVGDAKFDSGESKEEEKTQWNTVAMDYAALGDANGVLQTLDGYCDEAFGKAGACLAAMKALNDEMPQQMQNCLAWADTQSASESELNYTVNPEDANNTIVFKLADDEDDASLGIIRSIDDLDKAGFVIATNNGDWAAVPKVEANLADAKEGDLQARMTRGVADTTFTATNQLAAYTISATVSRINTLVTSNSSAASIPYSGVYTGILMAGTERYSQMQAHSIDTASIISGLAGDLRKRSTGNRTKILSDNVDPSTQAVLERQGQIADEMYMNMQTTLDVASSSVNSLSPHETTTKTTKDPTNSSKTAQAAGLNLSNVFASSGTSREMADVSSFDSVSMNRPSAITRQYNSQTNTLVDTGGMAKASASGTDNPISVDAKMAKALLGTPDGSTIMSFDLSGAYAIVQSVALLLVLVFLMIIAFQNFVGYVSGNEAGYIAAQTHLKTVLPRTLIAIAMIGLPPLAGGTGFQGGGFLLLEVLHSVVEILMSAFLPHDPMSMLTATINGCLDKMHAPGLWELLMIVIKFLIGLVVAVVSFFISLMCFAENIFLFLFWLLGPLFWAFYVWPYNRSGDRPALKGFGKIVDSLTEKFGSKTFTNGQVGNDAPAGLIYGYIDMLLVIVKWQLLMWVFAIVLAMVFTPGGLSGALNAGGIATSQASSSNDGSLASSMVNTGNMGEANPGDIWIPVAATALYCFFAYRMFKSISQSAGALGGMYRLVGGIVGTAASFAAGGIAGKALGIAGKATTALQAKGGVVGKIGKAMDTVGKFGQAVQKDVARNKMLKRAQQGQAALDKLVGSAGGGEGGSLSPEERQAAVSALTGGGGSPDRLGFGTYTDANGEIHSQSAVFDFFAQPVKRAVGKAAQTAKGHLSLQKMKASASLEVARAEHALDSQRKSHDRLVEKRDELSREEGLYQLLKNSDSPEKSLSAVSKTVQDAYASISAGTVKKDELDGLLAQMKDAMTVDDKYIGATPWNAIEGQMRKTWEQSAQVQATNQQERDAVMQQAYDAAIAKYDDELESLRAKRPELTAEQIEAERGAAGSRAAQQALKNWDANYTDRQARASQNFVSGVLGDAKELMEDSDALDNAHERYDHLSRNIENAEAHIASHESALGQLKSQKNVLERVAEDASRPTEGEQDSAAQLAQGVQEAKEVLGEMKEQSHDIRIASKAAIQNTEHDDHVRDVNTATAFQGPGQQRFNDGAAAMGRLSHQAVLNGDVDAQAAIQAQQALVRPDGVASRANAQSQSDARTAQRDGRMLQQEQLKTVVRLGRGAERPAPEISSYQNARGDEMLRMQGANGISMTVPASIGGVATNRDAASMLFGSYEGYMALSGPELAQANRAFGVPNVNQHVSADTFTSFALRSGFSLSGSKTNGSELVLSSQSDETPSTPDAPSDNAEGSRSHLRLV